MMLLTKAIEKKLPALYSQEKTPLEEQTVYAKFFTPDSSWTWYATEYDPIEKMFFGLVDGFEKELGYFSLEELQTTRGKLGLPIERDKYFDPQPLGKFLPDSLKNLEPEPAADPEPEPPAPAADSNVIQFPIKPECEPMQVVKKDASLSAMIADGQLLGLDVTGAVVAADGVLCRNSIGTVGARYDIQLDEKLAAVVLKNASLLCAGMIDTINLRLDDSTGTEKELGLHAQTIEIIWHNGLHLEFTEQSVDGQDFYNPEIEIFTTDRAQRQTVDNLAGIDSFLEVQP